MRIWWFGFPISSVVISVRGKILIVHGVKLKNVFSLNLFFALVYIWWSFECTVDFLVYTHAKARGGYSNM